MRVSLHRAQLAYGGGLTLHTASSGPVAALDTLYLRLVDPDGVEAVGEVRINVAYLNGLGPEAVLREARALVPRLDLGGDPGARLAELPERLGAASAPLRMLVDTALHARAAMLAGSSVAALLGAGGGAPVAHPTNQTLFLADDAAFLARAQSYVARGFTDLKVRIGGDDFAADLARLRRLRERFGAGVTLAADANGAFDLAAAPARLAELAAFDLAYVEQPLAPGPLAEIARLAEASPVPIMLDESVASERDVAEIAQGGHALMAHLKLVKLGGLAAASRAARALEAAGVPVMIGQMNEGGLATAAALHLCAARRPRFAELYGADGLANDPAEGLRYRDGTVAAPPGPGLGLVFRPERAALVWEN